MPCTIHKTSIFFAAANNLINQVIYPKVLFLNGIEHGFQSIPAGNYYPINMIKSAFHFHFKDI